MSVVVNDSGRLLFHCYVAREMPFTQGRERASVTVEIDKKGFHEKFPGQISEEAPS